MNNQSTTAIVDFWKENYTKNLEQHDIFDKTDQLVRIADIFSPGTCYYYVINLIDLSIDYISPSVETMLGICPKTVTMQKLLDKALESEMESINKKEVIVQDFFYNFLKKKR
ncbi:hypothetical protein [Formosa haliotis]|uniref:hypothetical protein n=1 Tax=Formosa haliotis TaxID=1555194 RepID=UPI000825D717|nr:hypothetical protein [Formosa haliotis]